MKSESQLDENLRKLISAVHPVHSQLEFKRELLNKLVHLVEARKQAAVHRHAVWQTLWRHPVLYAGISAAAVLLITFLFLHVERRAPDALQTASVINYSKSVRTLANDETLNKMISEIKRQNRPDMPVKPLGWDIKPPRPYGLDIKPPRPYGWDIKPPRPCG